METVLCALILIQLADSSASAQRMSARHELFIVLTSHAKCVRHFLIGLWYATKSKRLRTTDVE